MVLLPDLDDVSDAFGVANRLMATAAEPYLIEGEEVAVSLSVGVTTSQQVTDSAVEMIAQADMAMLEAKKLGRNTCHCFEDHLSSAKRDEVALRRDIQEALRKQQFWLAYQPLLRADGTLVGFEALLRWDHPVRGTVSPGSFIPLAEATGQIIPISQWVVRQACHDLVVLKEQGLSTLHVAVNLSALQFHRQDFLPSIHESLSRSGAPAERLQLELTEGILMRNAEAAIDILSSLQQSGIRVSIDDFGTGYSSLSYLKTLPIATIKIDRSFVTDVTQNPGDAAIVQGVITMAHQLGLKVIAEGIETEEQRDFLTRSGCDLFQGFWFARPMPLREAIAYAHAR